MRKLQSILLIDDDPIANFLNEATIEDLNICEKLIIKENGAEALEYLSSLPSLKEAPDLVLLDINMPVMDGLEFLRRFRTSNSLSNKSKVIFLTTSNQIRDINAAEELKADGYLTKPLTDIKLLKVVEEHFALKENAI